MVMESTKRERIEMAKQIASTVETIDEEISYIDTANLQDMHKEERMWIAKKIVSTIPHDWDARAVSGWNMRDERGMG